MSIARGEDRATQTNFEKKRERLIRILKAEECISSPEIERAFLTVPREMFLPEEEKKHAYVDSPLSIPCNQTISAPSMIAIMLEVASLQRGLKVLEIGAGSGYNAALLAELVGQEKVITIEKHLELVEFACSNLENLGYNIKVVHGDGSLGHEEGQPYDRIISTAGSMKISPPWIQQTVVGGRIVAPLGRSPYSQNLTIADKIDKNTIHLRKSIPCAFVPLVGAHGWQE